MLSGLRLVAPAAAQEGPPPPDRRLAQATQLLEQDPPAGMAALDTLLAEWESVGEPLAATAWVRRCEAQWSAGPSGAPAIAERGIAFTARLGPRADVDRAALHVCRGYAREQAGQLEVALADYRTAVTLSRAAGEAGRSGLGQALVLAGEAQHLLGRYADALADIQESYRIYTALDDRKQRNYVLNALANLYADAKVGEYDQALEVYAQLLEARRKDGDPAETATTEFNIASTLERKNALTAARQHFEIALALQTQTGDRREIADVQRALANVRVKQGDAAAALPLLDAALAVYAAEQDAAGTAHARLTRGTALAALDRAAAALTDLEAAQAWYARQDNPRFLERVHEEKAALLARRGDWQRAYEERMAALALRERLALLLKDEQTARLRTQFDVERREAENLTLRRERLLADQALAASNRVRLLQTGLIGAALAALLVVAALLLRLRARNRALAESNAALSASRAEVVKSGARAELIFKALTEGMGGEVLDGKYRLQARLGAGGFGTVYRAEQVHLGTTVAVKVFKPIAGHDADEALQRFRSEGVSAFRVQHPNAVRVLDFGIALDTVAYLAMEYLDGVALDAQLRQHGRLPWPQAVEVLHAIAAALAAAHAVGVVHRDVKPSNILLCRDGDGNGEVIKLIDFGIAKVLGQDTQAEVRDLTATGMFMGTPSYMAPERFVERPFDGRSDVYSLGIVAFELLSGRRPFVESGDTPTPLSVQHLRERPPELAPLVPEAPLALLELIDACLAKRAADRPSAAGLENCLAVLRVAGTRVLGSHAVHSGFGDDQPTQMADALSEPTAVVVDGSA